MPAGRTLLGHPVAGLLCLLVTYVVWGSTYLGIRIAVREGAGWPPFWMGASRVFVAAAILLVICRIRGVRIRPSLTDTVVIGGTGVLLWVGGNGAVNWAEQRIDSGLAALVVGAMPMWVVLMESILDRRRPSARLVAALVVGFAGLGVLTLPMWRDGLQGDLVGVAAVVFGAISWGAGSVWIHRRPTETDSMVTSGLQQLFGGFGFLFMVLVFGEPLPTPTPEAWAAWVYLVLFGSVFAYSCFIYALEVLPVSLVSTYTYVNPVIAVFLGWLLLSEPVTVYTFAGTVLIIAGVYGVFREKRGAGGDESPSAQRS
jgi:drug/metabolite transporter (DMT)-like permease